MNIPESNQINSNKMTKSFHNYEFEIKFVIFINNKLKFGKDIQIIISELKHELD
jgi:hypothetical protein